jgi:prepilin peptidase CpaA
MDVRYRRIPNRLVLITLLCGIAINAFFGGWQGLLASLGGLVIAFGLMFMFHVFGTMGAGDVKLFAAIGAVLGSSLVLPTFAIVAITGGILAVFKMVYARRAVTTMLGVGQFFIGLLPGQKVPRLSVPARPKLHAALCGTNLHRECSFLFSFSRVSASLLFVGELSYAK